MWGNRAIFSGKKVYTIERLLFRQEHRISEYRINI